AARRGIEEAAHSRALRQLCKPYRREVIDLVRDVGIQVAEGVVRQRREMNDGRKSFEVPALDVAQIQSQFGNLSDPRTKRARSKEIAFEPYDVVPRVEKHWNQDGSDVPLVPRDQYAHAAESSSHEGKGAAPSRWDSTAANVVEVGFTLLILCVFGDHRRCIDHSGERPSRIRR